MGNQLITQKLRELYNEIDNIKNSPQYYNASEEAKSFYETNIDDIIDSCKDYINYTKHSIKDIERKLSSNNNESVSLLRN